MGRGQRAHRLPFRKCLQSLMMRGRTRCCGLPLVIALASLPGAALLAQERDSAPQCDGQPVRTVDVRTDRPAFHGALAWWRKLARAFGLHHETTSPGLVRRFVSLDPGRACTEFRRSESERILRAQPYIADARVVTTRTTDGVHVDVSTVDEVPVVGGARASGVHIRALDF